MKIALVCIATFGVLSDLISLYFAFHSRRHEQENASHLQMIERKADRIYLTLSKLMDKEKR